MEFAEFTTLVLIISSETINVLGVHFPHPINEIYRDFSGAVRFFKIFEIIGRRSLCYWNLFWLNSEVLKWRLVALCLLFLTCSDIVHQLWCHVWVHAEVDENLVHLFLPRMHDTFCLNSTFVVSIYAEPTTSTPRGTNIPLQIRSATVSMKSKIRSILVTKTHADDILSTFPTFARLTVNDCEYNYSVPGLNAMC